MVQNTADEALATIMAVAKCPKISYAHRNTHTHTQIYEEINCSLALDNG